MKEEGILDSICNDSDKKWKGKYFVTWCNLCDTAIISCPDCSATSCNCQSCDSCSDDIDEFNKQKTCVEDYLTKEEIHTYYKSKRLKKFILKSMRDGDTAINWKKLLDEGKLSQHDCELFDNICPECGNVVDPEICHCGNPINRHGMEDGHSPVPMGCTCGYAKQRKVFIVCERKPRCL